MPTRYLKDSICTSETLAGLSAEAERFWYRLIVQCDDFGRMDGRPAILRARCFPLMLATVGEEQIFDWLTEMEQAGLVRLYQVDGKRYLEIVSFTRHNQLRAKVSKYPGPESGRDTETRGHGDSEPGTRNTELGTPGTTKARRHEDGQAQADADDGLQAQADADDGLQAQADADDGLQAQADAGGCLQIPSESESESESIDLLGGRLDLKSARARARGSPAPPGLASSGNFAVPFAVIDLTNAPSSLLRLYLDASGERGSPSPRFRRWFEEVTSRYTRSQCERVFAQLAQDVAAGRTNGSKWRHTQALFRELDAGVPSARRRAEGGRRRAALARNDPTASVVTAEVIEL